jgi:GT2 family glycosyltransferase
VDLCRRVRNIHCEIAFCRNITIEHNHGGSSRINLKTASLTKTEVHISRHVYISKHKEGAERIFIQLFLVINNLISGGLMALLGLLFFFVPKVFARTLLFFRLIGYYVGSLYRLSWISPRSVNFHKIKTYARTVQV